jgi:hypothetical protein
MTIYQWLSSIIVISSLLMGCGGGNNSQSGSDSGTYSGIGSLSTGDAYNSSSSSGRADYNVSVSDDMIVGARLLATQRVADKYGAYQNMEVCESFTELGGGLYTLNNCSVKPAFVTAIGGFIDLNRNGQFDLNESAQNTPLIMSTEFIAGSNFTITPLATLAAGYTSVSGYSVNALVGKFGFTADYSGRLKALLINTESQPLNRMVNAILCAATNSGFDSKMFSADLASRIVAADGTGVNNLRAAVSGLINAPESKIKYGDASIQSFWNDSRVQSVIKGTDAMSAMLAKKVPNGRLRISGLVTTYNSGTNIVSGAMVGIYAGERLLGKGASDRYGKYSIEINESLIPNDSRLLLCAQTSTLKLTSSVPTKVLLDRRVNGNISASQVSNLSISYVTTLFNDNNNTIQSGATMKKLLFDSTLYRDKNSTNSTLFIPMKILYENQLLPGVSNRATMKITDIDTEYLTQYAKWLPDSSVPYILDIEAWPMPYLPSAANDIIVQETVAKYVLVMNTMKAARPELKFAYWGVIPNISPYYVGQLTPAERISQIEHLFQLTLPIAQSEDFIAPGMYTSEVDQTVYFTLMNLLVDYAKRYNKTIIPYLWPEYVDNTPMVGTYIPDDYWEKEVILARDRCDGIAIWGGTNFAVPSTDPNRIRTWDENISWWKILKNTMGIN